MRGTLLVGLTVVLLIIGILVIKNMGADDQSGLKESQTKEYVDKAKNTADEVGKRLKNIQNQKHAVD